MQWRRRHCCTHITHALLSLLLFLGLLLILSYQDWRQGRTYNAIGNDRGPSRRQAQTKAERVQVIQRLNHSTAQTSKFWSNTPAAPLSAHAILKPEGNSSSLSGKEGGAVLGLGKLGANSSLNEEMQAAEQHSFALLFEPYEYVLNEPDKCQNGTPFVLLLVATVPEQREARDAIRQTWGNESVANGVSMVCLFLLGVRNTVGTSIEELQSSLQAESQAHHDIIQQDYLDTYYNLTLKTLMGMHWVATYCPDVSYVMKTDSDMFVNTEYLIQKLLRPEKQPLSRYFTGYLMRGYAPNRNKNSKWYMSPELYPRERYPTFCSGTGYVFSGDMAAKIYRASLSIPRLHLEDVYVGMCLDKLRIEPMPPPNEFLFNHWRVSYSSCKYSHLITSHQFQPSELIKYWHHFQNNKHNACINMPKDKHRVGMFRQRKQHSSTIIE